ncbi:MAG: hypothetical protein IJM53_03260 [Lachnospiraceae bacterium]|nr:hypothetical protein [Lachnospiraceae bacterium]
MIKKLITTLLAVMMAGLLCAPITALADDDHMAQQPDYDRTGSIAVDVVTGSGEIVPGGELTMYFVAEAEYVDGDNLFIFTEDYAECGFDLGTIGDEEPGAPELAADLAEYTDSNGIKGTTKAVDGNGHADFKDLTLGLYLVVQTTNAPGFEPLSPFLVSIPAWDGEQLLYDINAMPKPGTSLKYAKYDPPLEKLVIDKSKGIHDNDKFVFRMLPDEPDYPMPDPGEAKLDPVTSALTKVIYGPGSYEFGWMYFGLEDVGHVYTYKVFEVAGDDAHYKYDTIVYCMTITVFQDEYGDVQIDVVYTDPENRPAKEVKFKNYYTREEIPPAGQLWWPVPILAFVGLALFVFGLIRRKSKC